MWLKGRPLQLDEGESNLCCYNFVAEGKAFATGRGGVIAAVITLWLKGRPLQLDEGESNLCCYNFVAEGKAFATGRGGV